MVGWSDDMANVANQVLQLSQSNSDSTVLINGESGTGKELVAKAIHNLSNRESKKFIAINCGAIPANLLESELFGHERGSFTGATTKKIGKFQIANGGTIFLDEIGDMPLELQVKLLRVLQEGTIEPVGSTSPIKVNVRVLAATHVNLEEAISDGRFREDLFYRLNVIPIYLSPLRKRPDDIEPLLLHFQEKHKGGDKKILYKTLRYLKNYSWKGNVRELENTIDRLLTMVTDSEITPEHLDAKFFTTTQGAFEEFDCDYPTFKKMLDEMAEEKERNISCSNSEAKSH
jgi:transcriptional regulator with PAS, ATPase and Fis domain